MYGVLGRLDQMAREIEGLATRIRTEADDHHRRAEQARWVSAAADAYRGVARTDHDQAHRVADSLVEAAASLRDHAATARATALLLRRLDEAAALFATQVIAWIR